MNYLEILKEALNYSPLVGGLLTNTDFLKFVWEVFEKIKDGKITKDEVGELLQSDFAKSLVSDVEAQVVKYVKNM